MSIPSNSATSLDVYQEDDWPQRPDGSDWDGKKLFELLRDGESPFANILDVHLLLQEVEGAVQAQVQDIPFVHAGSNNYVRLHKCWEGFHLRLSDGRDIIARLANADVNMPRYDAWSVGWLHRQLDAEVDIYNSLKDHEDIPTPNLLYYRRCEQQLESRIELPKDISGRQLMIFEMAEGENSVWVGLGDHQKASIISQAVEIRAALANSTLNPTDNFVEKLFEWNTFQPVEWKPDNLPRPITPTRDFCAAFLKAKIEGLIKNEGDIVGWEEDDQRVGSSLLAAKASMLRLIPKILPDDDGRGLYSLFLQHDDYGIHNMSICTDDESATITSLYDWETGCVVPGLLTELSFVAGGFDIGVQENGEPLLDVRRPTEGEQYESHSQNYLESLKAKVPYLKSAIEKGKDVRHLWFALKKWGGDDAEDFFGELGVWAERRIHEIDLEAAGDEQYTNSSNPNSIETDSTALESISGDASPKCGVDQGQQRDARAPDCKRWPDWTRWTRIIWPWGKTAQLQ